MAISFKGILNSILNIFRSAAEKAWASLGKDVQNQALTASALAQAIKKSIGIGYQDFSASTSLLIGLPQTEIEAIIKAIAKDLGLDFDNAYGAAYNAIQAKAKAIDSDNGWNALWQNVMKFAATYISSGKLDWITLSLGVAQIAYEKLFKK